MTLLGRNHHRQRGLDFHTLTINQHIERITSPDIPNPLTLHNEPIPNHLLNNRTTVLAIHARKSISQATLTNRKHTLATQSLDFAQNPIHMIDREHIYSLD